MEQSIWRGNQAQFMTASLTLIENEAQHLIGRIPEGRCRAMQLALVEVCETHWIKIRGAEPVTRLAHTLWSIPPPLADLCIDLFLKQDSQLWAIVPEHTLARGLALVILAEIARGNESGVHIAHDPMMAFDTTAPPAALLNRMSALLHGELTAPLIHPHAKHGALWRALAVIAEHTHRLDLPAVLAVIHLLTLPADKSGCTV
ncbi:MAG: hypothetical protein P8Z75_14420 [Gammaproteobacteria bacterium]